MLQVPGLQEPSLIAAGAWPAGALPHCCRRLARRSPPSVLQVPGPQELLLLRLISGCTLLQVGACTGVDRLACRQQMNRPQSDLQTGLQIDIR